MSGLFGSSSPSAQEPPASGLSSASFGYFGVTPAAPQGLFGQQRTASFGSTGTQKPQTSLPASVLPSLQSQSSSFQANRPNVEPQSEPNFAAEQPHARLGFSRPGPPSYPPQHANPAPTSSTQFGTPPAPSSTKFGATPIPATSFSFNSPPVPWNPSPCLPPTSLFNSSMLTPSLFSATSRPRPTYPKPQYNCSLNMTIDTESDPADVTVTLNRKHSFRVSRAVLTRFSIRAEDELSEESVKTFSVETPFEEALLQVLMYAVYQDSSIISHYIANMSERILEVYAAAYALGVVADSSFQDLLLASYPAGSFSAPRFSAWNRKFIDYDFAVKLLRASYNGYGTAQFGIHLLEWLGEHNLTTPEEEQELLSSDDFQKVRLFWKSQGKFLNQPLLLNILASYPIASQTIDLHALLSAGLRLNF